MRNRILNSRKRVLIALAHSLVFALLAAFQTLTKFHPAPLIRAASGHFFMPSCLSAIYLVITAVLLVLARLSSPDLERWYFLFCTGSAGTGLLRVVFGDPTLNAGNVLRTGMLLCATVLGFMMLRRSPKQTQPDALPELV